MKFSDLDLDPKVLKAVEEAGYETPTPIQEQAIPHALMGKDVLGIAQTGTGKTAAFTIPMITILAQGRAKARMPRSLILCPTRELAAQVAENFETYGKYHKLTMALLIGGVSFKDQDKLIDRGVDVLIATPGRLLDHFERGKLMLTGVQVMVVDEADRMLDMGFIPDLERIFGLLPFTKQTLFFSATMPPEITRLTETFLHAPVRVEVAKQASAAETIQQWVVRHKPASRDQSEKDKREILRRLINAEGESLTNAIVFCNRKRDVDVVFKSLKKHGFNVGALHGDLDQSVRTRTLDGFRSGEISVLIASDVAARGLDIPSVSHVFNYDLPIHSEDYIHRIGRTGRAGRKGKAISICFPNEVKHLDKIEEMIGKPIPPADSPLAVESQAEEAPAAEAEDEGRGRRRTRTRTRKTKDAPKAEASDAAAAEQSAPDAPSEDAPAPAPRKSRSRKTAAEKAAEKAAKDEAADAEATEKPKADKTEVDKDEAPKREPRRARGRRRNADEPRAEEAKTEAKAETADDALGEDPRETASDTGQDSAGRESGGRDSGQSSSGRNSGRDSSRGRGRDREDRDDRNNRRRGPVVGMGDHVPAFMLREVNVDRILNRKSKAEDQDGDEDSDSHSEAA